MNGDRFDTLTRRLVSPSTRRSVLKAIGATVLSGAAASRAPATLAKPNDKVTICIWDPENFVYDPKELPPPAAQAQVDSGKALYPIDTDYEDGCAAPCGPECLRCLQTESGGVCTKCVNGQCVCPSSEAGTFSYQGGIEGKTPLTGTQYQIFNYDEPTQTIGSIPLSGIQTVTDPASPVVVFGPFPGDAPVCIKEVVTPAGYTVLHSDFACLHLGCGTQFLWDFRHSP